jgi:hypothetical protein
VDICIKGTVLGFPATLEALSAGWPFGVTYIIQTKVIDDPNRPDNPDALKLELLPRHAHGIFKFIARILLIESRGQLMGIPQVDEAFISSFNSQLEAERFMRYPGVFEKLCTLERFSKFSELHIVASSGLYLTQPKSLNALNLDVCRETFKILGEIGQVLFEAF